jgi:hypothetical protein
VVAPLYLLVCPWSVGWFLEDSFGVLFAWGFYLRGGLGPILQNFIPAENFSDKFSSSNLGEIQHKNNNF